jgi:hypothetical protein
LPSHAFLADRIRIAKEPPGWYERETKAVGRVTATPSTSDFFVSGSHEWSAHSRWSIQFRIDALDDDTAIEQVRREWAPAAKLALESIAEAPVQIELMWWGEETERGNIVGTTGVWSSTAACTIYEIEMATNDSELLLVDRLIRATVASPILKTASWYYFTAQERMNRLDGTPEATVAAFQRYFLVIESLAGSVEATGDPIRLSEVVDGLVAALDSTVDMAERVKAVQRASREIDQAREITLRERIRAVGGMLSIEDTVIENAASLVKVRNDSSHPRATDNPVDSTSLEVAQVAARTFLIAAATNGLA